MKSILIDSCFWMALYKQDDKHHKKAFDTYPLLRNFKIVVPWPTMYETLNTKFIKKQEWISQFKVDIEQSNIVKVDDSAYKQNAWNELFRNTLISKSDRNPSLVDQIIRFMLYDKNLLIKYLITYNPGDFDDVCKKQNIGLLDYAPESIY